jgi:hypothetical protein
MQYTSQSSQQSVTETNVMEGLNTASLHVTLRRENHDLAYLLGAWTSMTEIGGRDWLTMSFTSQDPRQLELLQQRVHALFGETPTLHPFSIQGMPYLRLYVPSAELAFHVREVTSGNTRIPWEHLGTEDECRSFLKGLFDHGGWVYTGKNGGIGFNKKGGDALLEDLCRVFARVGVLPIVVYGEVPSLKLKDIAEWRTFSEQVEISLDDRREAVRALASRPTGRGHYTGEDYSTIMELASSKAYSCQEMGEMTGIPTNTVRGWTFYSQKPPAVKRAQIIEGFTTTLGSPEIVNAVYRELGASSHLARACGKSSDPRAIKETVSRLSEEREALYGNDDLISAKLL